MTAEHMASCQNKKPCAPEQQKQDSPHRDRDTVSLVYWLTEDQTPYRGPGMESRNPTLPEQLLRSSSALFEPLYHWPQIHHMPQPVPLPFQQHTREKQ